MTGFKVEKQTFQSRITSLFLNISSEFPGAEKIEISLSVPKVGAELFQNRVKEMIGESCIIPLLDEGGREIKIDHPSVKINQLWTPFGTIKVNTKEEENGTNN